MDKTIFGLFPGQGSQTVGMGEELFDSTETAKKLFAVADEVLGFSLSQICFNGPEDKLKETAISQPAILTVSTICYELAKEKFPDLNLVGAAGHSLGEYAALVAAGALKFENAVLLVHKRGKFMQEAVPVGAGKMIAVLRKELSDIEAALSKVTSGVVEIANLNSPGQIVMSGDNEGISAFMEIMSDAKIVELPVSAPFHSSLMKTAETKLAIELDQATIKAPSFPIYANFTAQPETEPAVIRENLKKQVCGSVRWIETVENSHNKLKYDSVLEFGAGNILTGLVKRIDNGLKRINFYNLGSYLLD